MIGNILQGDIDLIIAQKKWDELIVILNELDSPDVAEVIIDLPPEQEGIIFRMLPRDRAAVVFSYLPLEQQEQLLHSLSNEQSRSIFEQMTPDDRARLLQEMPAAVTRRLLDNLTPDELRATRTLLGYPEGTAGRYMTPEYVTLDPEMTAAEALTRIRKVGRGKETLHTLYVVDATGKLLEDLRLGSLVLADPNARVVDIEDRPLIALPADTQRNDIIETFRKYDRSALPVTDASGNMLGIITADDVIDVAADRATEEIQKLGGTEALDRPYFSVGFWEMVRKRGGWLSALFLGEMLTATAMGYFQDEIERAAVVALFVPLIISSGGNSGSQGTSIMIRSLALKEIRLRDWWRVAGREIRTGVALGTFLGIVGFTRIAIWQGLSRLHGIGDFFRQKRGDGSLAASAYGDHWILIALTVAVSLIGVVTWGSLAGSMLPFILRRFGFDPATSSAPFVATLVDVTGLIIYFCTALVFLRTTYLASDHIDALIRPIAAPFLAALHHPMPAG
jgi:magnesium transporter